MSPAEVAARLMGAVTCTRGEHHETTRSFVDELIGDPDTPPEEVLMIAVSLTAALADALGATDEDLQALAARVQ
jgi:hypothetical protein